jgi:hypothetical protein
MIGGTVAAVAIGGTVAAVYLSLQQTAKPQSADAGPATSQAQRQSESPAPIDRRAMTALAPRNVKVTRDQGAFVELRWALPAGARRYPVVLQRSPVGKGQHPITALGQGATTTRVGGLDPDTGYCFVVGVALRISESSAVAWSRPTCVRGAVARQ